MATRNTGRWSASRFVCRALDDSVMSMVGRSWSQAPRLPPERQQQMTAQGSLKQRRILKIMLPNGNSFFPLNIRDVLTE